MDHQLGVGPAEDLFLLFVLYRQLVYVDEETEDGAQVV